MNPSSYVFHTDPGHGWLAVPKDDVIQSRFVPSPYSYYDRRNGTVYLEEDCDAYGFLEAAGIDKRLGEFPGVFHPHEAPCRNMPSFCAPV